MRLSELFPKLNPELQRLVLDIAGKDGELLPESVAKVLGYRSRRRVDLLCEIHILDAINRPTRRVLKPSVISYILERHGYRNIAVDLENLPVNRDR